MIVSWFSAGVSSAVATKLAINQIDRVVYTHIEDQHVDTMRFVRDCEEWFGKKIEILFPRLRCVDAAIRAASYINGPRGAACTRLLKRRTRSEWEHNFRGHRLTYVWGLDFSERNRADRIVDAMPGFDHLFPLIDRGIHKSEAHRILRASNITRPQMYDLGYKNNNCVGCIKGGMGYWNKIKSDFPDVFSARAATERQIGATCINGVWLDQLEDGAGRMDDEIDNDCGLFCAFMGL